MGSRNDTRDTLSATVASATGKTPRQCRDVLDTLLVEIICRCRDGQKVSIPDFGYFSPCIKSAKPLYNFKTKQVFWRYEYRTISFWVHPLFEEKVNGMP